MQHNALSFTIAQHLHPQLRHNYQNEWFNRSASLDLLRIVAVILVLGSPHKSVIANSFL